MTKKKDYEWNKVDWRELKDIHGNSFVKDIYVQLPKLGEIFTIGAPYFLNDDDGFQYSMYYGLKSGRITYQPFEEIQNRQQVRGCEEG